MACNTVEILERRADGMFNSIGWAGISCRHETDWYVDSTRGEVIADHLPNYEAAREALAAYIKAKWLGT
jgi:hypothetical protein